MVTFVVKVKNKQQEKKIRAALNLVDADFIENNEAIDYSEVLEKDIEQSRIEKKNGQLIAIDPKNLWKSIGL